MGPPLAAPHGRSPATIDSGPGLIDHGHGRARLDRMPPPGQGLIPIFDGTRVTNFVESFEMQCDALNLDGECKVKLLVNYCTAEVHPVVQTLEGYITKEWLTLRTELITEYRDSDDPQHRGGVAYLESLVRSPKPTEREICGFIRLFAA